jgi:diacylglycerol kinase family enzyme
MTQMNASDPAVPSPARRTLAVLSLLAAAVLVGAVIVFLVHNLAWLVVALLGLVVGTAGLWWVLTERLPRRAFGIAALVVGAALVVVAMLQTIESLQTALLRLVVATALVAVTAFAGRAAMAPDLRELDRLRGGRRVRPRKPVLLCNPKSGGGKVAKFGLAEIAAELGVEVVYLEKGLDLAQLARDAIARGADCLGMAGGDGSQALVASIAHEHDVPFVCISAGTRNHFAQDLGFDKEDPRKGMAAFRDGVERFIDYGTVGDRLFVNNVSLGIYATIVQQDSYRGAKLDTARTMLPEMLSHQAEPFDLQFTTPDGAEIDDAFVVQVSNNPYVWGASHDVAQRRTMDSGKLGVFAVNARTGGEAAALVAGALAGLHPHGRYFHEFTAETFEIRSRGGQAFAGIDGEALQLDTPLEFRIHPRALRMLVPEDVLVASERRRTRGYSPRTLVDVVLGRRASLPGSGRRADPADPAAAGDRQAAVSEREDVSAR